MTDSVGDNRCCFASVIFCFASCALFFAYSVSNPEMFTLSKVFAFLFELGGQIFQLKLTLCGSKIDSFRRHKYDQ